MEEDGERVDLEGGVEGGDGAGGVDDVELVERREAGGEGSEDGQPAERLAGLAGAMSGSDTMTRTPVRARMSSGSRARRLVDISGPPGARRCR